MLQHLTKVLGEEFSTDSALVVFSICPSLRNYKYLVLMIKTTILFLVHKNRHGQAVSHRHTAPPADDSPVCP